MERSDCSSWEIDGPPDLQKQIAKAREIPRYSNSESGSMNVEGKHAPSFAGPPLPQNHNSSVKTDNSSVVSSLPQKPATSMPPLPSGLPPLPPGPPPKMSSAVPPLPPGPPPSSFTTLPPSKDLKEHLPYRRAAPLPDSVKLIPPLPVSVSAFKTTVPSSSVTRENSVQGSLQPAAGSLLSQDVFEGRGKTRSQRRPRGMSLSSNARRSLDSYEKICQVGGGTYADVFKARDRDSGEIVALKKVRLEDEKEGFPVTALREIKFLSQVDHLNIVKLKEVVTSKPSDATRNKGSVFMVFEYAESDLVGLMKTTKLNESHIMCLMKQLLEALHFAHKNSVLHRDIKPSNVLVNSQGILKLADWGLCRKCVEGGKYTTRVVTRWYRAPELLLGDSHYTSAVDMWAVGCLMAELLLGRAILPGKDDVNQLKITFELCGTPDEMPPAWTTLTLASELLRDQSLPSQMNQRFATLRHSAQDLLFKMLYLDPSKRISAGEALDHDYFWGTDPAPCHPSFIPRPKGDGLHEFQLREQAAKVQNERKQHDDKSHPDKRRRHSAEVKQ